MKQPQLRRAGTIEPLWLKRGAARRKIGLPRPPAQLLERFERALEDILGAFLAPVERAPVAEQIRWHFGFGHPDGRRGKRLRPRLMLQIALDEGGTFEGVLDAALAVECLHNYSLLHDDIEDRDEVRHGRQAVWARFGLAHGINAGDSMCAVSYLALLRNSGALPPDRLNHMLRVLHEANFAMCVGQSYDLEFEAARHVTMDAYLAMIEGKTATLFGAACELAALSAGAGRDRAAAYGELGRVYGRAFQIADDVHGTWASTQETGKAQCSDIVRRKWTFPIVWALAGPPSDARAVIASRYRRAAPLAQPDVDAVMTALDALGARRAAEAACCAYACEAAALTERADLDRNAVLAAVTAITERRTSTAYAGVTLSR